MVKDKTSNDYLRLVAIPQIPKIYLPLLEFLGDGKHHDMSKVTKHLVKDFKLSKKEATQPKASGKETIFHNRVHWAKYNLKSAGYIQGIKKGVISITDKGKELLDTNPEEIKI
jgi:restriction system protein